MGVNPGQLIQLADACSANADMLQKFQQDANYTGPNMPALYAQEMSLRMKVLLLNTSIVGADLAASADAAKHLQAAIASAANAVKRIRDVQKALQVAADLITLAGGVISSNPAAVIGAAAKLIADATAPAPATPAGGTA